MSTSDSVFGRFVTGVLVASVSTILAACGVYDVPDEGGGGGGGGGSNFSASFQLPASGTAVSESEMLKVTGSGISRVVFWTNDEPRVYDSTPPYEVELDPLKFYPGPITIHVVAEGFFGGEQVSRDIDLTIVRPRPPLSAMLADINALPTSHWYEIPWSQMRDVEWLAANSAEFRGPTSIIMEGVSGGAFDTKRNRLVVFGGCCAAYRNDLYAFDFDSLSWERLLDPTPWPAGGDANAYDLVTHPSDSAPVTRKSYDALVYVPDPVDRIVLLGGLVEGSGGESDHLIDTTIYHLDLGTNTWSLSTAKNPTAGYGTHSAIDSNGDVWFHNAHNDGQLFKYDPINQVTTEGVEWFGWYEAGRTSDIDTANNRMIAVGLGGTFSWDLSQPSVGADSWTTTGDREIEDAAGPGVVYHAASGRIVAWAGGPSVYTLDLTTRVWTKHTTTGSVDPGPVTARGTFGRFCYVPKYDVFTVVDSTSTNVFVYRLPD